MDVTQGYVVYRRGEQVEARGHVDGAVIAAAADAATVIQEALDRAGAGGGGLVSLQPGTFLLRRTVRLPSRTTLQGSGRATTLRLAPGHDDGVALLADHADGVTVADLTLDGDREAVATSTAGIVLDHCGDCRLSRITAARFGQVGIHLTNNTFLTTVEGCTAADNAAANILLEELARGRVGDFLPNLVVNCTTYGGGVGIATRHAIVLNIVGCQVFQPLSHGYHIGDRSNSVLISGCRSFECLGNAVLVDTSHEINISSNTFCWHSGHGIEISGVNWGTITGNNVIDTGAQVEDGPPAYGIWLRGGTRGLQVSGNAIFNWGGEYPARLMESGIREDPDCFKNLIAVNTVNFAREGVRSDGDGTIAGEAMYHLDAYLPNAPHVDPKRLRSFIDAHFDHPITKTTIAAR